ncbi:hypothetical protein BCR33DRAFT_37171 [Rhizoclosmatium globosum]|uniref:Uncharacterized protein n=1 Tax=Rhizoclosmatium globosum TaxID=329046 RepID=A0A1Y2CND4_9FUNG|nr:hypothetical protein BCR33DRAFT_37171 [Rhizoclosmatium globosum]|eukprot:ORY48512.1 hypothetical protein BCR33DRAFT_37171 [Rhizoclosmatium globosum]
MIRNYPHWRANLLYSVWPKGRFTSERLNSFLNYLLMPSCTVCAEFNLALLSDVLDLRSELLHKTEKLIVLLGGVAQTSPYPPRKGPHPLKESFSNDGIEVIPNVPKSPRDPSPISSHLDLGLRWTADDYKLDIEANKSTVPTIEVFDKTRNRRLSTVSAVSKQSKKSKSERIDQSIPLKSSMDILTNIFSNRNSRVRRSSITSKRPLSQVTTHVVEITAPKSDHEIVGSPPNQKSSQFSEKLDNAAVTTTNAHKSDGTRTKGESIAERVLANQSVKSSNTSLESAKSSSMLPSLGRYMFAQNTALQQLLKRDVNATRNQQSLVGMERNLETIDSNSEFSDSAVHRSTHSFADMADKEESNMMHNYAFASFKPKKSSDQLLRHSSDRIEYVPPPNAGFPVKKKSQQIGKSQEFALKPKPGGGNAFTAASQEIVHGWSSRASAVHASKRHSGTGTVQSHDGKENREDAVYKNAGGDNGKGWLGSVYLFLFLLPAFDNKGRPLTNDSFDGSDLDGISFEVHGLHPKSYFCTALDFIMSSLFFVCLWIIPFMISYDLSEEVLLGLSLTHQTRTQCAHSENMKLFDPLSRIG